MRKELSCSGWPGFQGKENSCRARDFDKIEHGGENVTQRPPKRVILEVYPYDTRFEMVMFEKII
jgi:hypothetical protein